MKKSTLTLSLALMAFAANVNAQTPDDPAALSYDPAEVGVIFAADQEKYPEVMQTSKAPASDWAPVSWGQKTVLSYDECNDGAAALRLDNLDFLPMQFQGTLQLGAYKYLHIDVWAAKDDLVCFKLQNWWPGEYYVTPAIDVKGGEWLSLDIDITDPLLYQWGEPNKKGVDVFQVCGENVPNEYPHSESIYLTNIIAHNYDPAGVANITVDAAADNRTFNLFGMEVDENYQGVVIRNGKKFIQR